MPYFKNRSGELLWYEDSGSGIPLLFLHGWCMSSVVWQSQFMQLNRDFRVIAPDLRGHGKSRAVSGHFDFEHYAADLEDLVQCLELERIILIGWSMGAQIAIQVFDALSEKLAGLVLVSATPCFTVKDDFPFGLARNEAFGMRLKVTRNLARALDGFHGRMFAEGEAGDPHTAIRIKELLDSVVPPDASVAVEAIDSLADADMRPLLARISLPVLILNGDRDPVCLPQASDYLMGHIKFALQKVFSDCGHAFFITRPEMFNNEIIQYTRSVLDHNA